MQWSCSWADSCLAAGLQVLHLSLAVYVRLRLRLGDEQHPKVPANKRRMIKTKQKMQITTSPPRAQSLVIIRFFRSSRSEDASCTCDMLSFTLLEVNRAISDVGVSSQCSEPQSWHQYRHTCCLYLQASLLQNSRSSPKWKHKPEVR